MCTGLFLRSTGGPNSAVAADSPSKVMPRTVAYEPTHHSGDVMKPWHVAVVVVIRVCCTDR